jgi:hypothetical protein
MHKFKNNLYASHPIVFAIKQTTFVQNTHLFNQFNCHHIYDTCFGLYLGNIQVCQHKKHTGR